MVKYVLQTKDKGIEWGWEDQTYLFAMAAHRAWDDWWKLREEMTKLAEEGKLDADLVTKINFSMPNLYRELQAMDVFMAGRHSKP